MKRIISVILLVAIAATSVKADRKRRKSNIRPTTQVDSIGSQIKAFNRSLGADSLNVEQIAFDYFISMLDSFSFDAYSAYRFNRSKQRILYSGNTDLFSDFLLGNFKTYSFKKKKFIDAGTFDERNNVMSCEHTPRPFTSKEPFCVREPNFEAKLNQEYKDVANRQPPPEDETNPNKPKREYRDVYVEMSNRYYFQDNYYVRIKIVIPDFYIIQTFFYVKINASGEPINWVATSDIE